MATKYNPTGVSQFFEIFLEYMASRKRVANFLNYEMAKSDVLMEIYTKNDTKGITMKDFETIILHFEKFTDLKQWFKDL